MAKNKSSNFIDIVLPDELNSASASLLLLCELFIEALIKGGCVTLTLSVDENNRSVNCLANNVREVVKLILGTGKWRDFNQQLTELLHEVATNDSVGDLLCSIDGQLTTFRFRRLVREEGWAIERLV